jgi:hypothetical protein
MDPSATGGASDEAPSDTAATLDTKTVATKVRNNLCMAVLLRFLGTAIQFGIADVAASLDGFDAMLFADYR